MESTDPKRMRLRLVLGKYRVVKVDRNALGVKFVLELPNSVRMTVDCPPYADIREGDLLTIYTEALTHTDLKAN